MRKNSKSQSGFSLVEFLIAIFIFSLLFALITVNLLGTKNKASLAATVDIFITDLKTQQLKAMVGDTEGRANTNSYGIHFETGQYTLFHGTYSSSDSTNYVVALGDNIQFGNTSFPSSQINFSTLSGEVAGVSGSNTITFQNIQSNEQKTLTINKYGIVTSVN